MSLHHGMLLWLMRQPISRTRNNCLFPSAGLPVITTFMKIYRLSPCPRQILRRINESTPWYAIMADETADITNKEQLSLSICWVASDYNIHEDLSA